MNDEVERLRAAILSRYKTLYAFCKRTGLPRGTVYQVMSRRYAGNNAAQLDRIQAALDGKGESGQRGRDVVKVLADIACASCGHGKKTCRKKRHTCRRLWQAQAAAICALATGGNKA